MPAARTLAAVASTSVLLVLTACAGLDVDGPLTGGSGSSLCMVQPDQGHATVGDVVRNGGDGTIVLKDLALVGAENLDLVDTFVIPMDGTDEYVLGAGSTEPEDPLAEAAWAAAVRPDSFELPAGAQANVVVAVRTVIEAPGTAEGIRVTYSLDGRQYTSHTPMTIELSATSCVE